MTYYLCGLTVVSSAKPNTVAVYHNILVFKVNINAASPRTFVIDSVVLVLAIKLFLLKLIVDVSVVATTLPSSNDSGRILNLV